jgi:AP-2 complex subunit alpha
VACRHRQSIVNSLQDTDISIRRRSLDLLFAMCNKSNVCEIVAELLTYLQASPCILRAREAVFRKGVMPRKNLDALT